MIVPVDMVLLGAVNWHSVLFWAFAALACGFGAGVLFSANVVRMAFYLVVSLAATAALFLLAGAEFLGAMQIMIYVGGTLVLLIFGVMLTAQEAFVTMKTRGGDWIAGLLVGACFLLLLGAAAVNVPDWRTPRADAAEVAAATTQPATTQIGMALSGIRVDGAADLSPARKAGLSGYLLAFEAVGVHLLVVLVGAAYLSRSKRFIGGRARTRTLFEVKERKRSRLFAGLLILGIVANVGLAVATIAGGQHFQEEFPEALLSPPAWLLPVTSLLFLLTALLVAVVWGWQRWGLVAAWLVPVVQGVLLANNGLATPWAVGLVVFQLVPLALITGLACVGNPSAWSQMD